MSEDQIIIDADEQIGVIKLNNDWRIFYLDRGDWMLDYTKNNDEYVPSEDDWRYGFLVVDTYNADEYFKLYTDNEVAIEDILKLKGVLSMKIPPIKYFVDFDNKLFVDGTQDYITIDQLIPLGWQGITYDPRIFLPDNIRKYWD